MVILKAEHLNCYERLGEFKTRRDAEKEMLKQFDGGFVTDFIIEDNGDIYCYSAHKLPKVDCPRCGKETRPYKSIMTKDCHGIPYRPVCEKCYAEILDGPGYDGEYYDELDECIFDY